MIKLAVFDWNGTLLADTMAEVVGVNEVLKRLNRSPIDLKALQATFDLPIANFYNNLGIDFDALERSGQALQMAKAFHARYEPAAAHARTRPGARHVLAALSKRGVTNIILSNHSVEGIYLQLERLNLLPYFTTVLAHDDVVQNHLTRKEQYMRQYFTTTRVAAAHVAIIGDTADDVKIGKTLGFRTIAITGGYNSTLRLKEAKPDVLISKLDELLPVLDEM